MEKTNGTGVKERTAFEKALEASKALLGRKGYEVVETEWACPFGTADVVALEGDDAVFAKVYAVEGEDLNFSTADMGAPTWLAEYERVAALFLAEHPDFLGDEDGFRVRFESLKVILLQGDMALVRHAVYTND